ncbi:LAMI_0F13476g1_1 [Lachancea mirantina]|uniref:LAMI_0F13476g1_1 n=1 Tax=Lachancea mirantina TaxID=1230905 RepID=A0A1G4K3C7_9SACH|nr:LAMI_0F13476g1_1 [Lachancea mirantina]
MDQASTPEVTSLDQDLRELRNNKFSTEAIDEISEWVYLTILKKGQCPPHFLESLKDGVTLCELANILSAADSGKSIKIRTGKSPFMQMEQISQFLSFARLYGVPEDELFQTVDLYEDKDAACVYQTLKSVSRYANQKHPDRFPVIGPQIAAKRAGPPVKSKPDHLKSWSTLEYGYMKGANQASEKVVFGRRRDFN